MATGTMKSSEAKANLDFEAKRAELVSQRDEGADRELANEDIAKEFEYGE